ncbi:MAG: exosortase/archaeosortase family protein [Nitrospirota bacterium]
MRGTIQMTRQSFLRLMLFLCFNIALAMLFREPLYRLAALSRTSELYSHIPLVPLISGYLVYLRRKEIFSHVDYSPAAGGVPTAIASILYIACFAYRDQENALGLHYSLSLAVFAFIALWIGGFITVCGSRAFRGAAFPLLFLLNAVPLPHAVLEHIIRFLQAGSAETVAVFFKVMGIPFDRAGFVFHLPGISIEIAEQCSGIRSSIVLFMVGTIISMFLLKTAWRRGVLIGMIIPLVIIKNSIRIVTLSFLAVYVDAAILTDSILHRSGGILFFMIALFLLTPILGLLRRSERSCRQTHQRELSHSG